jgi:multidrug efflux pump subunit AcrA (membrane-fusion protein)
MRLVQIQALRQHAAVTTDDQERARLESTIARVDGERNQFARQIEVEDRALERLVLRANTSGVVSGLPRREEIGKLWEKDQGPPFCTIGDSTRLRVLLPVTPADYRLLQEDLDEQGNLAVTLRVQGWEGRTWRGKVTLLPPSEARTVPLALTTRAGGPLEAKPGGQGDAFMPQKQHYLVGIDVLDAEGDPIWPGSFAQVKIHCRWRSSGWWLWRLIRSIFGLGAPL